MKILIIALWSFVASGQSLSAIVGDVHQSAGGGATPAFVSVKSAGNDSVSSLAVSSYTVTSGNTLAVGVKVRNACSGLTFTVTDTASNTFTQIGTNLDLASSLCLAVFYAKNVTGGTDTITFNIGSSQRFPEITVMQFSGASTSAPLDTSATGTITNGATVTSGAFTTTTANEALFAYCAVYSGGAWTAGASYTIPTGATDAYAATGTAEYQIVSSTQSSVTAACTSAGASIVGIMVATFK